MTPPQLTFTMVFFDFFFDDLKPQTLKLHCHRVASATHQVAHVETLAKAANPTRNTATQVFEDTGNVQPWWLSRP